MKNVILQGEVFNQKEKVFFSEWKERFNQLIKKLINHKISKRKN